MMSAILKVKPQIDQNDAKKMEKSLFDRFKNIGKEAKKTLKDVVSGGLLGFAVGLAQNMLSPIEEVENRIKGILDKATEFKDMAEDFNSSSGKMRQLEMFGLINGLKADSLKSMMTAFRDTVDSAREQKLKKEPLDEKQSLVKNFLDEKDSAEGFFKFVQGLRNLAAIDRERVERGLFGSVQRGGAKRFIDNVGVIHGPHGYVNPRVDQFSKANDKLSDLDLNYQAGKFSQDSKEILNYSANLNKNMIDKMLSYENRQKEKQIRQLKSYDDLAAARLAIDKIAGVMDTITGLLTKAVGYLGSLITWLEKSPTARGVLKVIGIK